jgi:hypothetical protein
MNRYLLLNFSVNPCQSGMIGNVFRELGSDKRRSCIKRVCTGTILARVLLEV